MVKYYRKWISDTLQRVSGMNHEQMSGGISYIYLNLLYKLDYFLIPQGTILSDIERMSWAYFNDKDLPVLQKINNLEEDFKKLLAYDDEKVKSNFYKTKGTFGIVPPTGKQGVDDVINNNINNIKWYVDNNHPEIAMNILEYISGYTLFTYGLNVSLRKLLGLLMRIINSDFVLEINGDAGLTMNDVPNRDMIVKEFNEYISLDKGEYPEIVLNYENIKFDTKFNFVKTTIEEILKLNYKN